MSKFSFCHNLFILVFLQVGKCILTLSLIQTHFDAFAEDDFWKHCGKDRNKVFNFIQLLYFHLQRFPLVLCRCFQTCLLQRFPLVLCRCFQSCLLQRFSLVLCRCFQTCLLQNCCMWERVNTQLILTIMPSPGSSVGSDAGCQSRGCEFESRLGQLSFRRLTKVNATYVIRLPPMG